eukprot:c15480_g1_i1 orf=44-208(-)
MRDSHKRHGTMPPAIMRLKSESHAQAQDTGKYQSWHWQYIVLVRRARLITDGGS